MTFERRLAAAATAVDGHLRGWLLDGAGRLGLGVPSRLQAAMTHALLGGGKRFRPFLVIESSRLFDVESEAALTAAAALECVHCYSLVHDDLPAMDNDEVRRGAPSVWKEFDDWTAILAGDALLTLAFEILGSRSDKVAADVRSDLVMELARAAGRHGMVGGQCLDLEADKLGEPPLPDMVHILRLQEMKTGALTGVACQAGAILGRAAPADERALSQFGQRLGLAFQIADDLLDAEGEAAIVGKATGKDAGRRKATLVSLLGLDAARAKLEEIEAEALACVETFGAKADVLREAVRFAARRRK
jgi:farnesyl diphosphate synthase